MAATGSDDSLGITDSLTEEHELSVTFTEEQVGSLRRFLAQRGDIEMQINIRRLAITHREEPVEKANSDALSTRKDFCILILDPTGSIRKNSSESQWKKKTLEQKYRVADAIDYRLLGIALYRDCDWNYKYQDGAVIGIELISYEELEIFPVRELTIVPVLMDLIYKRATIFTLQNALVLKAEEWMKKDSDLLTGSIILPRNLDHQALLYDQEGMKSYMESWEDYIERKRKEKKELGDIGKRYTRRVNAERQALVTEQRQGGVASVMAGTATLAATTYGIYTTHRMNKLIDAAQPAAQKANDALNAIVPAIEENGKKMVADLEATITNLTETTAKVNIMAEKMTPIIDEKGIDIANNFADAVTNLAGATSKVDRILAAWEVSVITLAKGFGLPEDSPLFDRLLQAGVIVIDIIDGTWKYPTATAGSIKLTARVIAALGITGPLVKSLTTHLASNFQAVYTFISNQFSTETNEKEQTQSLSDVTDLINTAISTTYAILTKKIPTAKQVKDMMANIKDFNALVTFKRNAQAFFAEFFRVINAGIRAAVSYVFPSFGMHLRCMTGGDVAIWYNSCIEWMDKNKMDTTLFYKDKAFQSELETLYKTGRGFAADAMLNAALQKTAIGTGVSSVIKTLQPFYDRLLTWRGASPVREVPYGVFISGKPGIGKSTVTSDLVDMLIDPEVPKVDRVYSRNVQEDYWSGYRHQPCVVMDDIGNYTEGKDAEDIMKMFSPSPFLLEMAAVEEKGTAFSSRLVLMTANMDFPTTTKVKDLKALWRRRNYCVQMKMYRDDDIPDSERTRPQPTEFLDDMSHAYFIRFQPDIKSATGDIVPIGTPMSYDEFLDDVINDYERFVKNRYTPTDNIKAKIAARNQSLVTRGVNAIKQAGEYIWHELRKDTDFGDYAYLKESTVKVFDPLTEEEVIPPPQWERCCKHPGCALPAAFIIHTHERHSWQEVKGARIDNLKDQEVIKCENELHPSWVRFYPKINPRNLSQSSIPTTGEYHYYFFDKNVTIWDCTSTWYERTFDGRGAIRWLGDHFLYIYLGLCVAGVISQMIFQIYSAYQDAKRNEEQALEAKMRRKVLEMQAKETKQASSMVSPGTSEVHIRSKRFNKPRDLAERQALDEAVAEMTTYAAQNDVKYIAEVLNSEHELVQKEKWCKQMELIEEIEYYFTEEWRPEIELDEALAPLWDGSNSDEAFEKLKIHLVGRYMTALDALDDMKRMIKTADDFLVNAAVFGSARDHILLCTALLQRKDLIDSWKQIGIQLEADYPENAAFITRLKRVLLGGHDYVKLAETEQAFEKGIAMAKGKKQRIKTEPREFKMANPVMEHEEGQSTSNGKKKKKTSEEKQSDDPNADQLADRFFKSMVKITVTSETDDKDLEYSQTVNGVGVRGQFLLIPRHVFCGRDGQLLTIGHDNKCKCGYAGHQHKVKIEAWWSASQFADVIFDPRNISTLKAAYGGEDSDMVIFYCGPRMAPFKDNTEHFLQADDIERLSRFQVTITTLRYGTDGWRPAYVETEAAPLTKKVSYFLSAKNEREEGTEDEIKDLRQMNGWEYAAPMQKGDCGAPIICKSTKMIKKMIGIHVSLGRAAATGYGEVVLKERLMDALNELIERRGLVNSVRQGLTNIPDLEEVPETMRIPEGNFTILGRLPPAKAPRMAQETNLRKSVVYGKVHEATCEPAILTPMDPRAARLGKGYAPMWNNVKKFGSRTEEFHPERLAQAADFIKSELFYHMDKPQHQRRVCTEDEVINGNFGFGWESMDLDTSPGFQWTKGRKAGETGKRHLFTEIEGQKMVKNILLRQTLDEMEDEMRRGIMTKNLWTCTLKDEKREKWKVALGKTRVFIAAPITFTMLCRKYTLAFSSAFIEARLDIPSAVGINAFSSDWNRMITILEQNGQATIAGDFGNWDGHMHPEVIDAVCDIINEWYGDSIEDQTARKVMFTEMVHNMEVANNIVFYKHYGNPSGNPLTTVINTIGNMIYFALGWLDLAPEAYRDLCFFKDFVKIFFYGDDHIGTVSEPARGFYNMITLEKWFSRLGHEYTPPEKNEKIEAPFYKLYDTMFLKCRSVEIAKKWWPKMERATISEMTNWIRKCDNPYMATVKNCCDALRFLFFYGRTVYNEERKNLQKALDEYSRLHGTEREILPTYDFFNEIFGKEYALPLLKYEDGGITDITMEAFGRRMAADEKKLLELKRNNGIFDDDRMTERQSDVKIGPTTDQTEPRPMTMEPNEENAQGVIKANQSVPEQVTKTGTFTRSKLADGHMSDARWDLAKMVERTTLVDTFAWNTTMTQGTLIWQKSVPRELLVPSSINHVPFDWFHYWRGRTRVTFQVNGTQWHNGRLAIIFVPLLSKAKAAGYYKNNLSAVTAMSPGELDPAVSSIVEMEIDFCHPRDFLRPTATLDLEQLGTLNVFVLSELRCGENSKQSIDVSVQVEFEENQFKVLKGTESSSRNGRKVNAIRQGNTFTTNNNFKDARDVTIGQHAEADGIGSGLGKGATVALDKPNMPLEPPPVTANTMGYMSNCQNIPFAERLALEAGKVMRVRPEHFGTKHDEMDLIRNRQKFSLEKTTMWKSENKSGDILLQGWIAPLSKVLENKIQYGGTPVAVTTLDYLSAKNTFWKGGLKVKIVVVGCSFHVGKLFFGLDYGDVTIPTTLLGATSEYGVYIDVNAGRHEFEYIIKYQGDTPAKRIPNGYKGGFGNEENLKYALGVWSLRVVNELVTPHETSEQVEVMVYFAAAEDYRTYGLDYNNRTLRAYGPQQIKTREVNAIKQSGDGRSGAEIIAAENKLAITDNFGERYDHIQDFLKRFTLFYERTGDFDTGFAFNIAYLTYGIPTGYRTDYGTTAGLWPWFMASFAAQRGTMRFKVSQTAFAVDRDAKKPIGMGINEFVVSFSPLGYIGTNALAPNMPGGGLAWNLTSNDDCSNSPAFSFTNGTLNSAVQVEVPYQTRYNFTRTNPAIGQDGGDDEYTMGTLMVSTGYSAESMDQRIACYMACGDEFRLGVFLGPPRVYAIFDTTNSNWPDTYTKAPKSAAEEVRV